MSEPQDSFAIPLPLYVGDQPARLLKRGKTQPVDALDSSVNYPEFQPDKRSRAGMHTEFYRKNDHWHHLSVDQVCDAIANPDITRAFIVTDAGLGKSTTLGKLQYVLQRQHPSKFVVKLDLPQLIDWEQAKKTDFVEAICKHLARSLRIDNDSLLRKCLTRAIEKNDIILLLDGIDETLEFETDSNDQITETGEPLMKLWEQLIEFTSGMKVIFAGRISRTVTYSAKGLLELNQSELVVLDEFSRQNQKNYLPSECFTYLDQLESDVIGIPRALNVVRETYWQSMQAAPDSRIANGFNQIQTGADLYITCIEKLVAEGVKHLPGLAESEAILLFSAIAFQMFSSKGHPDNDYSAGVKAGAHFDDFCDDLFKNPRMVKKFESNENMKEFLDRLLKTNEGVSNGILESGVRRIEWRDRTLGDFFTALYVLKFATAEQQREFGSQFPSSQDDESRYWVWRFVAEFGNVGASWIRPEIGKCIQLKSILVEGFDQIDDISDELVYRAVQQLERMAADESLERRDRDSAGAVLSHWQAGIRDRAPSEIWERLVSRFRSVPLEQGEVGFEMRETPITNQEYVQFKRTHAYDTESDDNKPAVNVSWFSAALFCTRIGNNFLDDHQEPCTFACRLPTKQEWVVCCLAGSTTGYPRLLSNKGNFYDLDSRDLPQYAQLEGQLRDVDEGIENLFGLKEMQGNCQVWCLDSTERRRVVCGCSINSGNEPPPAEDSLLFDPRAQLAELGFRPVRIVSPHPIQGQLPS